MLAIAISPFCRGSKTLSPWPNVFCSSSICRSHALVIRLRRMRIARSLALAEETGLDTGLASSRVESRPINCRPLWVWWSHPQSEDAGEVEADVYVVDGEERGVLANDRVEETDEAGDGLRAVLRRRRPVVRREEGVNGWKRDEVRIMIYLQNLG